jgi:CubicO group peptidase (beta-lactamase class C family)
MKSPLIKYCICLIPVIMMITSSHYLLQTGIADSLDEWSITTPEEQGMSSSKLDEIDIKIKERDQLSKINSMLVVRHGILVYEKYYNNFALNKIHKIYSITKSVVSALIGIAIDKGYIDSIDAKVLDFFPGMNFSNMDANKEAMTIKHLLTMTSGLAWYEDWSYGPPDIYYKLINSTDPLKFILDTPVHFAPGSIYSYNQACAHLLSLIIQKVTGNTTLSFAQKYLFGPIGIQSNDYTWETDKQGVVFGNIGIELTPRNLAKFGLLFLNNGTWNNNQVVPNEWHSASTKNQGNSLGYLWWIDAVSKGYYAQGYLYQIVHVLPETDMVIVFTSNGSNPKHLISNIVDSIITSSSDTEESYGFEFSFIGTLLISVVTIRRKSKYNA